MIIEKPATYCHINVTAWGRDNEAQKITKMWCVIYFNAGYSGHKSWKIMHGRLVFRGLENTASKQLAVLFLCDAII